MAMLMICREKAQWQEPSPAIDVEATVVVNHTPDVPVLDPVESVLAYWRKALFPCRHLRLNPSEGKHFCPDCNEALVLTWVQLRCGSCRRRLPAMALRSAHGDGLMCPDRCCSQCGSSFHEATASANHAAHNIEVEVIHDPQIFHLSHAVLALRPAAILHTPWPVSVMPEPLSVLIQRAMLCLLLLAWSMMGAGLKSFCYALLLPAVQLIIQTLSTPTPMGAEQGASL